MCGVLFTYMHPNINNICAPTSSFYKPHTHCAHPCTPPYTPPTQYTYESTLVPPPSTFAIGYVHTDSRTVILMPVHTVLQMRPSMQHLDAAAGDGSGAGGGGGEVKQEEDGELKQVKVKVKKKNRLCVEEQSFVCGRTIVCMRADWGGVKRRGVKRRGVKRRGVKRRGVKRRGVLDYDFLQSLHVHTHIHALLHTHPNTYTPTYPPPTPTQVLKRETDRQQAARKASWAWLRQQEDQEEWLQLPYKGYDSAQAQEAWKLVDDVPDGVKDHITMDGQRMLYFHAISPGLCCAVLYYVVLYCVVLCCIVVCCVVLCLCCVCVVLCCIHHHHLHTTTATHTLPIRNQLHPSLHTPPPQPLYNTITHAHCS